MNSIFSFLEIPSETASKMIIKHNSIGNSDCNTAFGHPHFAQIKKENSQIAPDTPCLILLSNTEEFLQTMNSRTASLK